MTDIETAPEGTQNQDPAPECPHCGGKRYWSDYWTDELVALCVTCICKVRR